MTDFTKTGLTDHPEPTDEEVLAAARVLVRRFGIEREINAANGSWTAKDLRLSLAPYLTFRGIPGDPYGDRTAFDQVVHQLLVNLDIGRDHASAVQFADEHATPGVYPGQQTPDRIKWLLEALRSTAAAMLTTAEQAGNQEWIGILNSLILDLDKVPANCARLLGEREVNASA